MERLGVRIRVMASSTAVRTAEETRVKEPSFLPTSVVATDSHSLHAAHAHKYSIYTRATHTDLRFCLSLASPVRQ